MAMNSGTIVAPESELKTQHIEVVFYLDTSFGVFGLKSKKYRITIVID